MNRTDGAFTSRLCSWRRHRTRCAVIISFHCQLWSSGSQTDRQYVVWSITSYSILHVTAFFAITEKLARYTFGRRHSPHTHTHCQLSTVRPYTYNTYFISDDKIRIIRVRCHCQLFSSSWQSEPWTVEIWSE